MYIVIIGVIVAAILIYFSFKPSEITQPELVKDALEDIATDATVTRKTVENDPAVRRGRLKYFAVFTLDNGEEIEFTVTPEIYGALRVGNRDTLIYHGSMFVGFGNIGAAEDSGSAENIPDEDDFTLDDYDESIDVEIPIDTDQSGAFELSEEDRACYKLFMDREKLPAKTETISDETRACLGYPSENLFDKITVYPFLKRDSGIREMFMKAYSEALTDLRGYDGDYRTGRSADSIYLRKNEIRVAITIEERPQPLLSRIEAEFGVNDGLY